MVERLLYSNGACLYRRQTRNPAPSEQIGPQAKFGVCISKPQFRLFACTTIHINTNMVTTRRLLLSLCSYVYFRTRPRHFAL